MIAPIPGKTAYMNSLFVISGNLYNYVRNTTNDGQRTSLGHKAKVINVMKVFPAHLAKSQLQSVSCGCDHL